MYYSNSSILSMKRSLGEIILFSLIAVGLFGFLFFGMGHAEKQLASFADIIRARVTINPLEVEVSAPEQGEQGRFFKVTAVATNRGTERIENVKAEIFLPEALITRKDTVQKVGSLPGKRTKTVSWQVRGEAIGVYVISIKISGLLGQDLVEAEDSTVVEVVEELPRGGGNSFGVFQNFLNFFRRIFGL